MDRLLTFNVKNMEKLLYADKLFHARYGIFANLYIEFH